MAVKKHTVRLAEVYKEFQLDKNTINILNDISLHIYPQEFTIIYGPSGSGKSTLLNTILGLEPPTKGNVYVNGRDLTKMEDDERGVFRNENFGVVYQQSHWIKTLNVLENVALPLLISGRDTNYAVSRAQYSLSEIGMDQYAKRSPLQLSGGQQQKVSVARALVSDPSLIVADEPTGNLDSSSANELIELFVNLIKNFSRTVVMVTHDLRFLELADRAFKIIDGQIIGTYEKKDMQKLTKEILSEQMKS